MFSDCSLLLFLVEPSGCVGASCQYRTGGLGLCRGHELREGKVVSLATSV